MQEETTIHLLYGFPGVGKLTIATEMVTLLRASGHEVRLVDNHLVSNPIFGLIEQDGLTPLPTVVWERVGEVRDAIYRTIANLSPRNWNFIFTNVLFDDPDDVAWMYRLADLAQTRGNRFRPTMVTCSAAENERRVVSPERRNRMKSVSVNDLRLQRNSQKLPRPPDLNVVDIDATTRNPRELAESILAG